MDVPFRSVKTTLPFLCQAYMDLLSFERKLDSTIMRKRLDIQEALKRPMKQKRKLRIFISNTAFPARDPNSDGAGGGGDGLPPHQSSGVPSTASWELRVEGRIVDEDKKVDPSKAKRKFSSFFKSLVIELDKDLYGPDNHLVEWHRTPTTQETDGFQVGRRCTCIAQQIHSVKKEHFRMHLYLPFLSGETSR